MMIHEPRPIPKFRRSIMWPYDHSLQPWHMTDSDSEYWTP